ncbi:MAG: NADH-quinone oxidoreductase subunit N [Deltaproteobacteria bacterium]|nr:NADH-quinone oxidoreductase subunit N [Deltaproteobacteria bacterium]
MDTLTASQSLIWFQPELALVATIVAVFLVDLVVAGRAWREIPAAVVSALGLALVAVLSWQQWSAGTQSIFQGMAAVDPFAVFFKLLIAAATLSALIFLFRSNEMIGDASGEAYALVLVMALCGMLLASANNLLMVYLALEGVSIASYVLAGYSRRNPRASEAALKYVIYGGVASGVMLFGLSYLYGVTGTLDLTLMRERLSSLASASTGPATAFNGVLLVAAAFVIVGIGYKVAAVPFHMWCPDVYEGAPTPIAALFSVVPKAAGLAVLIRFFYVGLSYGTSGGEFIAIQSLPWVALFGIVAAATMTVGNFAACWQTNLKRLLAYSSIAHVGYALMGFVVLGESGLSALLYYLAIYAVMNLGAFFCVVAVRNATGSEDLDGVRGLGTRDPLTAAAFTVFLLSLVGLPPFAGFVGKYFLFAAVLERAGAWYDALVVVAAVNTAVSLFFYAKILKAMYLTKAVDPLPIRVPGGQLLAVLVFAAITLVLGFWAPGISRVKGAADGALVFVGYGYRDAQVASLADCPGRDRNP